jgi:hypothetical protein
MSRTVSSPSFVSTSEEVDEGLDGQSGQGDEFPERAGRQRVMERNGQDHGRAGLGERDVAALLTIARPPRSLEV